MDRISITDRQNRPRFISEGDETRPHPEHEHEWDAVSNRCVLCQRSRTEVDSQESE